MADHAEVIAAEARISREKEALRKKYIEDLQALDTAWQVATRKYYADKEAVEKAYELRNSELTTELVKIWDKYDKGEGFIA